MSLINDFQSVPIGLLYEILFFLDGSRKGLATRNAAPIILQSGEWQKLWDKEGRVERVGN